jgi:uncharacterized protein with GYD domain
MAKFITLGVYTAKGLAGFVNNPDTDRKAATSALAAAAGAKLTRYAGLRGKYDFMAEMEGTFDQAAAAAMVAVSSGAVSDFTILEDVNLNAIAKTAKLMATGYKEPGK